MGHKLGRGVRGFVLKYHTVPTIRFGITCEKQCNTASESHSRVSTIEETCSKQAKKIFQDDLAGTFKYD